ncbi:hypothetical protein GXP75_19655 [Bacillus sp. HU-1818]|nr:hypothetical protein [Bacillus sp. HU-1818]
MGDTQICSKHKTQQLAASSWSAHIQVKLGEWVLTANFGVTNCGAKRHRGKKAGSQLIRV